MRVLLLLILVTFAYADNCENEISVLREEVYHLKNAIWGILNGFEKGYEDEATMGFRERYTSPYGKTILAAETENNQRRQQLLNQCLIDKASLKVRYPFGSSLVSVNCDDAHINEAVELLRQQQIDEAELGGYYDDYDDY